MTRLQLCQRLHSLLRSGGGLTGTAPTDTTTQEGKLQEIVNWIDFAYQDIQNDQDEWAFRSKQGTYNTTSGTRTFAISGSVADYDALQPSRAQYERRFILCHLTSAGVSNQTNVYYIPYEDFQQGHYDRGVISSGKPQYFTIRPDGQMTVYPNPDDTYTLTFDYRRTLHAMTADADEPILPEKYQMAIVWWAVCRYYCTTRDGTGEFLQKSDREMKREMRKLYAEQLPEMTLGSIFGGRL